MADLLGSATGEREGAAVGAADWARSTLVMVGRVAGHAALLNVLPGGRGVARCRDVARRDRRRSGASGERQTARKGERASRSGASLRGRARVARGARERALRCGLGSLALGDIVASGRGRECARPGAAVEGEGATSTRLGGGTGIVCRARERALVHVELGRARGGAARRVVH